MSCGWYHIPQQNNIILYWEAGHPTSVGSRNLVHERSVGSCNLVHERTIQSLVTKKLSLNMKLRIYQTCILPIVLYGSETWTLLSTDTRRLQAFHIRCQRRILGQRQGYDADIACGMQKYVADIACGGTEYVSRRLRRQLVYHRSATSSAHVELHSPVMWWGSENQLTHSVPSASRLTPVPDVHHSHPGDSLVVETHCWSLWCSRVH